MAAAPLACRCPLGRGRPVGAALQRGAWAPRGARQCCCRAQAGAAWQQTAALLPPGRPVRLPACPLAVKAPRAPEELAGPGREPGPRGAGLLLPGPAARAPPVGCLRLAGCKQALALTQAGVWLGAGARQLELHVGETTIAFPLRDGAARELSCAITALLQTLAAKQAAERPRRWPAMEFKVKGAPSLWPTTGGTAQLFVAWPWP